MPGEPDDAVVEAVALARRFHDTYERLAPAFGYKTRDDTKQFDPDTPNGKLMVAVCADVIAAARPLIEREAWRPIETRPDTDMAVMYYFGKLEFHTMDGGPSIMGPIRDHAERCELGFYMSQYSMWCEAGTGHDVFEEWRDETQFPTHWMPLPASPALASSEQGEEG